MSEQKLIKRVLEILNSDDSNRSMDALKEFREYFNLENRYVCDDCGYDFGLKYKFKCKCGSSNISVEIKQIEG